VGCFTFLNFSFIFGGQFPAVIYVTRLHVFHVILCEISGSHGGEYEANNTPGYRVVQSR
jgi:hypothetical protein